MKKQGFLYGSAVLVASALIVKAVGALFRIPLANMLGGEGMGYFSAAYGIFMPVYAVSATGLPAATARAVSVRLSTGDEKGAAAVKKNALTLFSFIGLAGTLLIMLLAYPFCLFVSGDIRAFPSVIAIAPSVLAACLVSVYRGYWEGMRNMYPTAVSQLIEGIVKLAAGLALCFGVICFAENDPEAFMGLTGGEMSGVVPVSAGAAVTGVTLSSFAGLGYMLLLDRKRQRVTVTSDTRRKIWRELLKTAVPAAVGALVINLTSLIDLVTIMRSMKIIIKKAPWTFSSLLGAGISYDEIPNFIFGSFSGLAVTLFNLVPSLSNMFGKSMLPMAAAAKERGDTKKLGECSMGVLFAAAFVSFPAGLGICTMAGPLLELLFRGRVLETVVCTDAMRVLGAAVPFVCISSAAFSVLQAADRADIPVKIMAAGAAVKLAGNLVLTVQPRLNITGAALSTLVCYIVIAVMAVMAVVKHGRLEIMPFLSHILRISCSGMLCASGAFLVYSRLSEGEESPIITLVSVIFGLIIYIISTYFSGVISKSTLKMLIS